MYSPYGIIKMVMNFFIYIRLYIEPKDLLQ